MSALIKESSEQLIECRTCRTAKPSESFHKDRYKRTGRSLHCRACVSERLKLYRDGIPGWCKRAAWRAAKRARAMGVPFDLTAEWLEENFPSTCPALGIPLVPSDSLLAGSPSLDRVNPAGGYTQDNVRIISFRANTIKSDASRDEIAAVLKYLDQITSDD